MKKKNRFIKLLLQQFFFFLITSLFRITNLTKNLKLITYLIFGKTLKITQNFV